MTYPNSAKWELVPDHMHDGLKLYFDRGVPPGSFMTAVLSNDLRKAFACADHINRERLFDIVSFLYTDAPSACWGSSEKVSAWVEMGGLMGSDAALATHPQED